MNNILSTINVLLLIMAFFAICSIIWATKVHYNLKSKYALLICYATIFILFTIKLIIKIIVNENITDTIFYVLIWALMSYNQIKSINSKKSS